MKSKTTVLGILTIIGALVEGVVQFLQNHPVDYAAISAAVLAGVGLIKAQDQTPTAPKA
jgi:hypothetical protein